MGRMKFGTSLRASLSTPPDDKSLVEQFLAVEETTLGQGLLKGLTEAVEAEESNPQIIYVDRPVEVIREFTKTVEVEKIVEVIKEVEKVIFVDKIVLVEAATPPAIETVREVIVEKEVQIKNEINTVIIYLLGLSILANIIQGLF